MKDCNKIYLKPRKTFFWKNDQIWGTLACENSRPSSLSARVAYREKDETPLGPGAKKFVFDESSPYVPCPRAPSDSHVPTPYVPSSKSPKSSFSRVPSPQSPHFSKSPIPEVSNLQSPRSPQSSDPSTTSQSPSLQVTAKNKHGGCATA